MITTTSFFDASTSTFSYIIADSESHDALIIDPVLDYEPLNATISFDSINRLRDYIERNNLKPRLVLDTHLHADHMTAAFYLKNSYNIPSAIGENFLKSQLYFSEIFNSPEKTQAYDYLLKHEEIIKAGTISIKTLFTPGHTPSCASYLIEDSLFVGDTLFQPELGCGRADFPQASALELYNSIKNIIYTLPEHTLIYVGHDYPSAQEDPRCRTSVYESKLKNIMLDNYISETQFIKKRTDKDQSLQTPQLLLPAIQINIRGGQLPEPNEKNQRFLFLPLTLIDSN